MKIFILGKKIMICTLIIFFVSSCAIESPANSNVDDQIDKVLQNSIHTDKTLDKKQKSQNTPAFLTEALTPTLSVSFAKDHKPQELRFDIAVKDVSAKDFFMGLVKDTKENIVVSPDVSGVISLNLQNVTIPEVLETVRNIYGYEYQHSSSGYEIFGKKMETRIFTVNYLDINRKGKSTTTISSGQITNTIKGPNNGWDTSTESRTSDIKPSSGIDTTNDADFWKNLRETLDAIVGKENGASVVINPQAGLVVVHAHPDALRHVAKYLDTIQNITKRQVIIEARVLEVALNANYQAGINWNIFGLKQGTQPVLDTATGNMGIPDINDNLKSFTDIFSLKITNGDAFNSLIKLLNTQGKVNVLSSPHISTLNNQKAVIKVGEDQFFVTNVKSNVVSSSSGSTPIITQDIEFTPFFTGIALDVTPQIDKQGNVILHIHPIISKVTEQNKVFKVNGQDQNIPLAKSDVRESDSVIEAKSGQVVVIGGLMENRTADFSAGTPGLEKTPHFGGLFKNTNRQATKFELVILLRPIVVESGTWTEQLQQKAKENISVQSDFAYESKLDLRNK
jgi:MSHA biogenesis protein MshL